MPSFELPSLDDMILLLERKDFVLGLFLGGAGLVFMLLGLRIFNVTIAVSFAGLGFVIGKILPVSEVLQWVCAGIGAVILGVASRFIMKAAVAILGGGWAGFVAYSLVSRFGAGDLAATLVGIVALGIAVALTFIMYHELIAFVTSVEGTLLFLGGMIVCLSHTPTWMPLQSMLTGNVIFGPFFIVSGVVIGFFVQMTDYRKHHTGQ